MFIAAYAGARPLGRPLPPLAAAPQCCGPVPLHILFSFARDVNKDGRFEFYDPWQLEHGAPQLCGGQRGMLSLAGAGFGWGPAVPLDQWVSNAASTLQGMLERWGLCGLDINYEEGLDAGGFPEAMAALAAQLKASRPALLITVSPFDDVWPHYRCLLQLAGSTIDLINWQVYAELESPAATSDQVVAAYERLAAELGGFGRLTLGVNTEPDQLRGPQLAASLDAFRRLKARGLAGAFTWALDNSAQGGYQAERALLAIAAEEGWPPGDQQQQQQQPAVMPPPPWYNPQQQFPTAAALAAPAQQQPGPLPHPQQPAAITPPSWYNSQQQYPNAAALAAGGQQPSDPPRPQPPAVAPPAWYNPQQQYPTAAALNLQQPGGDQPEQPHLGSWQHCCTLS